MSRRVLILAALPLYSQQVTLNLRVGDAKFISGFNPTNPLQLVIPNHGWSVGQKMICHSVQGHQSVNSNQFPDRVDIRRVGITGFSANTFTLLDENSTPIAPVPNAVPVDITPLPGQQFGICGPTMDMTLRPPPHLIAPPGTAQRKAIDDPDGAGPLPAPAVLDNPTQWAGLTVLANKYSTLGCDGVSPGLCKVEEATIRAAALSSLDFLGEGSVLLNLTVRWFLNQSDVRYLNSARYYINRVDRWCPNGVGFGCNESIGNCGRGSGVDWAYYANRIGEAYVLLRSQLPIPERQLLADKIFNNVGCRDPLKHASGSMSVTAGSNQATGTGFSTYAPGDVVFQRVSPTNGGFHRVALVQSDSVMTLTAAVAASNAGSHVKVNWQPGDCGWRWLMPHSDDTSPPPWNRRTKFTLQNAITATDNVLTVTVASWPEVPLFVPFRFYALTGAISEWFEATATNAATRQLTVNRGYLGFPARAWNAGTQLVFQETPLGSSSHATTARFFLGDYRSNRAFSHNDTDWILGVAFSHDDPRARARVEMSWAFQRDFTIPYLRDHWTGLTQAGGVSSYHMGRFLTDAGKMLTVLATAFTSAAEDLTGLLKGAAFWPLYFSYPTKPDFHFNYADSGSSRSMEPDDFGWLSFINHLRPNDPQTASVNFWWAAVSGLNVGWGSLNNGRHLPYWMLFNSAKNPAADYRSGPSALPSYHFFTWSDTGGAAKQFGALVSKTDWTPSATVLVVLAPRDPNDHTGFFSGPGQMRVFSKGVDLMAPAERGTAGGSLANTQAVLLTADTPVGGLKNGSAFPETGQNNLWELQYGGQHRYMRLNTAGAYATTPQQARVQIAHMISGGTNLVVRYDEFATVSPTFRMLNLPYYFYHHTAGADAKQNPFPTFSRSNGAVSFRSGQFGVSLLTEILLPTNPALISDNSVGLDTNANSAYKVQIRETTTASEYLTLHWPVTDTVSVMPTSAAVNASAGWRLMEWKHPNTPFVVGFSRDGVLPQSLSFATTHQGTAEYLLGGLPAGTYSIVRNGVALSVATVTAGAGALTFSSLSGSFTVGRTTGPPPPPLPASVRTRLRLENLAGMLSINGRTLVAFPDGSSAQLELGTGLRFDFGVSPPILQLSPAIIQKLQVVAPMTNIALVGAPVSGSIYVFRNRRLLLEGPDYTVLGSTIVFPGLAVGDVVQLSYRLLQ